MLLIFLDFLRARFISMPILTTSEAFYMQAFILDIMNLVLKDKFGLERFVEVDFNTNSSELSTVLIKSSFIYLEHSTETTTNLS